VTLRAALAPILPISASLAVDLVSSHSTANVSPPVLQTPSPPTPPRARIVIATVHLAQVPNSTNARRVQPVDRCCRTEGVYLRVPRASFLTVPRQLARAAIAAALPVPRQEQISV
jgi:hypothetical protein